MTFRTMLFSLLFLGLFVPVVNAGTFTGTIKEISADGSKITVYSSSKKKSETFSISGRRLKVLINSKPAKPGDLEVGYLATVLTDSSGNPLKIFSRQLGGSKTTPTRRPPRTTSPSKTSPNPPANPRATAQSNTDSKQVWPQYLGPNRDNKSPETGLLTQWPANGPKLLWTARNLGEGYSAVSVANGKVFTMGTRSGREIVIALDLATGKEAWATPNGNIFQDGQGNGPRSTPSFDNGKLYSLGASGDLSCLDANTGRGVWKQNILSSYGGSNIVWGISESPLVDGDKVICTPGGSAATMVALNKQNGTPIWLSKVPGNPKAGYSSPIVANIQGTKQYINFCHNGLLSVNANNGQPLWGDDKASNTTANCSSPIAIGNSVFYASGYGTGGALISLNSRAGQPNLVYKTRDMKNHHGGMVHLNGFIYGANEQILTCLNAQTGAVVWQDRLSGKGKGAITYADGHLYFRSEQGPMFLIEAKSGSINIKSQFNQPERSGKPSWARPVVADGKLFLRDQDILLCYEVKK